MTDEPVLLSREQWTELCQKATEALARNYSESLDGANIDIEWLLARAEAAEAKVNRLVIAAYQSGYSRGHNDTVEGCYNGACEDDDEAALEWLAEQEQTMSERTRTHWEDCWKSSDHHECAVARMKAAEAKYQNDLNAAIAIVIAISEPTGHADTFESLTAEWVDRMIEAEAKLEAMRKLVTDWRIEIPKLLLVGPEAADALASCADELEALLKEQTK